MLGDVIESPVKDPEEDLKIEEDSNEDTKLVSLGKILKKN